MHSWGESNRTYPQTRGGTYIRLSLHISASNNPLVTLYANRELYFILSYSFLMIHLHSQPYCSYITEQHTAKRSSCILLQFFHITVSIRFIYNIGLNCFGISREVMALVNHTHTCTHTQCQWFSYGALF